MAFTSTIALPQLADVANQPADVRFVLDDLLARGSVSTDHLFKVIDGERVALSGVSLGGLTTLLTTYHRDWHDPRVKAAVDIAGPTGFFAVADHAVVAWPAAHHVVAGVAAHLVVAVLAHHRVVAVAAVQLVVAEAAVELVLAGVALDVVIARAAVKDVALAVEHDARALSLIHI